MPFKRCKYAGLERVDKIAQTKFSALVGRVEKMLFSITDFEFMKLIGLCRYMPAGLNRKYDSQLFDNELISNLCDHRIIKITSDSRCYKLTKKGRDILAKANMTFAVEARPNMKRKAYNLKLKNAHINLMLYLAGVNVYFENTRELSGVSCGYMSSLLHRADNSMKVLSSSKFLGVFKLESTAYIPYYVEERKSWIYPNFERDIYRSQVEAIRDINDIKLMLVGSTLEELWLNVSPSTVSTKIHDGQKPFHVSMEEIGSEYLLIPTGRDGVLQLKLLTLCGYKKRISKALSCKENDIQGLSECDGWKDGMPFIVGVDFNIKRILRGLKQIEKYDNTLKPVVCCLPFQKSTYLKVLKRFSTIETFVFPISLNEIYGVFPEVVDKPIKDDAVKDKRGETIRVPKIIKYYNQEENSKA